MAYDLNFWTLMFILAGGILPALFWLWFWLKEDQAKPEPHGLVLLTFLTGGIVVLFAAFFQCIVTDFFVNGLHSFSIERLTSFSCLNTRILNHGFALIFVWAAVEEGLKLFAAWISTRHRKALNEPVDYMIYLVTAAIGFAAVENTLYLLAEFAQHGVTGSLASISIRFAGATLLHVLASSLIGGVYALAYCRNRFSKVVHTIIGFGVATLLHTIYNLSIIKSAVNDNNSLPILLVLWFAIVLLLLFFEKVKQVVCVIPLRKKK